MWDHAVPARSSYLLYYPCPESPPTQSTPLGLGGPWSLLVLEVAPSCTYIFPAQCGFAALTENISYRVEPREQKALFCRPTTHVDPVSRNRRDPAPSGVALSVQPATSPKEVPPGELNPPNLAPAFSTLPL